MAASAAGREHSAPSRRRALRGLAVALVALGAILAFVLVAPLPHATDFQVRTDGADGTNFGEVNESFPSSVLVTVSFVVEGGCPSAGTYCGSLLYIIGAHAVTDAAESTAFNGTVRFTSNGGSYSFQLYVTAPPYIDTANVSCSYSTPIL